MISTYQRYKSITANISQATARAAAQPDVAREVAYFSKTIQAIKTPAELVKNERLFRFVMSAFGLGEMNYAKGLVAKILAQDPADAKSLVNKMPDARYKPLAKAFNFSAYSTITTSRDEVRNGVVQRYITQRLEQSASEQDASVGQALYFRRMAPSVKDAYGILADPALINVVSKAFDLPAGMRAAGIDAQAELIKSRLDVADLKDPKKLERLLQRFFANQDSSGSTAGLYVPGPIPAAPVSLNADLLFAIQKLKR